MSGADSSELAQTPPCPASLRAPCENASAPSILNHSLKSTPCLPLAPCRQGATALAAVPTWPKARTGSSAWMPPSSGRIITPPVPATLHPRMCLRSGWPRPCWRNRCGPGGTQGAPRNDKDCAAATASVPDREALGRSRGGFSTKIHLAADSRCRPVARVTTAGQRHDSLAFTAVMNNVRVLRPRRGRPRTRPGRVAADKAYSTRRIRTSLRGRGITATIPEPANQITGRLGRASLGGHYPLSTERPGEGWERLCGSSVLLAGPPRCPRASLSRRKRRIQNTRYVDRGEPRVVTEPRLWARGVVDRECALCPIDKCLGQMRVDQNASRRAPDALPSFVTVTVRGTQSQPSRMPAGGRCRRHWSAAMATAVPAEAPGPADAPSSAVSQWGSPARPGCCSPP